MVGCAFLAKQDGTRCRGYHSSSGDPQFASHRTLHDQAQPQEVGDKLTLSCGMGHIMACESTEYASQAACCHLSTLNQVAR